MNPSKPPLSVAEALTLLLVAADQYTPSTAAENLNTFDAINRVLATAQTAEINVPPLDNSQMDGYAARVADCQTLAANGTIRLPVSQRIPAGKIGTLLQPNSAARIFTGAAIPDGADAVVMQEHCSAEPTADGELITLQTVPASGQWIRRTGEDIKAGAQILSAGTRLRPQHLGLAASVGLAQLPVTPRLKVAIFFTGDELAMPGETLKPGAIYNSNRFTLCGLLQQLGCVVSDYGIVPDTLAATRAMLRRAAAEHDLIVTSGGVSVGEEDHIKPAVAAEGQLDLWQIAVKPGKPLAFGRVLREDQANHALLIGLPGNPVSSFVTFLLFVRPFILRLQGVQNVTPQTFAMRADFNWPKPDRRNEFLRAQINLNGGLDLFSNQGSAVLTSTVWGDGLIDNPAGQAIQAGDSVRFLPFNQLLF